MRSTANPPADAATSAAHRSNGSHRSGARSAAWLCRLLLPAALCLPGVRAAEPTSSPAPAPASTSAAAAATGIALHLPAELAVDRLGLRLPDLAPLATVPATNTAAPLPLWVLHAAPGLGTPVILTRGQIQQVLARPEFGLTVTQWTGAERVRLQRRTRICADRDLEAMVVEALQPSIADAGELELKLSRPWTAVPVPDEALTARVVGLPGSGLTPLFNARVEILAGTELVGSWPLGFQARIWREIWVARTALRRGQTVSEAEFIKERRDVLGLREPLAAFAQGPHAVELSESMQAGAALCTRHLRLSTVIRRGQNADAILQDGAMNLVLKVEALEDGAPGQIIRLRNPASRRELRGKVQNERTVVITL